MAYCATCAQELNNTQPQFYAVGVMKKREKKAAEEISRRAEATGVNLVQVLPTRLKGYIVIETSEPYKIAEIIHDVPEAWGIVRDDKGNYDVIPRVGEGGNPSEIEQLLNPPNMVDIIKPGMYVEITDGVLKKTRRTLATVKEVQSHTKSATIVLDGDVKRPFSISMDYIRPVCPTCGTHIPLFEKDSICQGIILETGKICGTYNSLG